MENLTYIILGFTIFICISCYYLGKRKKRKYIRYIPKDNDQPIRILTSSNASTKKDN